MPITLGQLTANRKSATVRFDGGGELHIDYYPRKLTAEMLTRFAALDTIGKMEQTQALDIALAATDMLLDLLADWDLVEHINDDGTPGPVEPITRERVASLGLEIQWTILGAMVSGGTSSGAGEAKAPEGRSPNGQPSGATSSPAARSGRSRTGTR